MTSTLKFRRRSPAHREQGYILLTLMFLATLVILSLVAVAPQLTQQIKRDQEEELIHRGVQYSRAIQHFYKRTGRYPVRLEDLDNFNNLRFLRKHYKDPITGEDFKLLHFGEVQTMFAGAGAGIPGAAAASNQPGGLAGTPNIQGISNNPVAGNQAFGNQGFSIQTGSSQLGGVNQPGQTTNQSNPDDASNPLQPVSQLSDSANPNAQVFGGAPIVGVASTSKKKSIREFNKKNHYKDWLFIYDPSSDRGGLLNTPAQPNLLANGNNSTQGNASAGQVQGAAPGVPLPNSFGQQGMPMPNQPPDQMQQQQQ
jgi:type II secretory pathway pseudopilin PulG